MVKAAWLALDVEVYGRHGLETERQDIILPLEAVPQISKSVLQWHACPYAERSATASIPTHLLTHLDTPV